VDSNQERERSDGYEFTIQYNIHDDTDHSIIFQPMKILLLLSRIYIYCYCTIPMIRFLSFLFPKKSNSFGERETQNSHDTGRVGQWKFRVSYVVGVCVGDIEERKDRKEKVDSR